MMSLDYWASVFEIHLNVLSNRTNIDHCFSHFSPHRLSSSAIYKNFGKRQFYRSVFIFGLGRTEDLK